MTNIRYEVLPEPIATRTRVNKYRTLNEYKYFSPRYKKWVTVPKGFLSDGATGARDLHSDAWWVHDVLCDTGKWDCGTKLCNWQCSVVLNDILKSEGHWFIDRYWKFATFLFGGGEARKNGLFSVRN